MYIQVSLLNGFLSPLLYKVPQAYQDQDLVGTIVGVPLRNRITSAIVIKQWDELPERPTFVIKEFDRIEPFPQDDHYSAFIKQLSYTYQIGRVPLIRRVRQFIAQKTPKPVELDLISDKQSEKKPTEVILTDEQQAVCDFVSHYIYEPKYAPTLMHGVTGSGKTEVYKAVITKAIAAGKSVILLLPEVTLALQFERLLRAQLSRDITLISFHSGTGIKDKRTLWQRLLKEQPTLIIGVHIPILLPIGNLGLIIVDEEHEHGYQEKRHPKINTRQAAVLRAQISKIPILLGSATPSLASLYAVKTKQWKFFQLKKRFGGTLPEMQTIFLTDKNRRPSFWISRQLQDAIADRLSKKEQVIIFLNRRGFSFFVQCKSCSFIFSCKNCSVSLTLHDNNVLNCHYCGINQKLPETCPSCKASEKEFIKKGIGTQQAVTILEQLFPQAKIARADLDTSSKKKSWQQTIADFEAGAIDMLVGTQTITKGFHFPRVTLVGIIWADLNLHFPVFHATEATLSQLIQVAGRAGRSSDHSTVIVQAMMDHPIYQFLNETDYLKFYTQEIESRIMLNYPPAGQLVEIELKSSDEVTLEREAHELANALRSIKSESILILGPTKPVVHKIQSTHMRMIFIKSKELGPIIALWKQINVRTYHSSIYFTPIF